MYVCFGLQYVSLYSAFLFLCKISRISVYAQRTVKVTGHFETYSRLYRIVSSLCLARDDIICRSCVKVFRGDMCPITSPPNEFILLQIFIILLCIQFLAHLSTECSVSYCDHSPSVGVRPSVRPTVRRPSVRTNESVFKWLGLARVRVG